MGAKDDLAFGSENPNLSSSHFLHVFVDIPRFLVKALSVQSIYGNVYVTPTKRRKLFVVFVSRGGGGREREERSNDTAADNHEI